MSRQGLLRSLGQCCMGLVALLVVGGAAEVLPVSLNCPLPFQRTHPPTLVCCFCVFAALGVTSTQSGRLEVNLSLSGKRGGKSHLGTILLSAVSVIWRFCMVIRSLLPMPLETVHDPKKPVLLIALKITQHAELCLSVIMFLICVCCVGTQKGCAGHCLLVGRGGKFDLLRVWTIPHVFDYIGCLFCIPQW